MTKIPWIFLLIFYGTANAAVPKLEIVCERNCPPVSKASTYDQRTQVSVKCLENCEGIDETKYKWSLRAFDAKGESGEVTNYDVVTVTGRYGPRLVLKSFSNQQEAAVKFQIKVEINDTAFPTVNVEPKELRYIHFEVLTCATIPLEGGVALKTDFSFFCLDQGMNEGPAVNYEFYCGDNLIVQGMSPEVFNETFKLPSNCSYFSVKYTSKEGVRSQLPIPDVNITDPFVETAPAQKQKELNTIYEGLKVMLMDSDRKQRSKGLRNFVTLTHELTKTDLSGKESRKWLIQLQRDSGKKLLHTPIDNPYVEVVQMSKALNVLMQRQELPKSDPSLLKLTSTLCTKMANKYLETAKKQEYPIFEQERNDGVAKALTQCTENHQNPDFEIFKNVEFGEATKEPTVHELVVTENYPDYEDFDDKYFKNLHDMEIGTNNIINSTLTAAKIVALSMVIGESPKNLTLKGVETIVCKDEGKRLLNTSIQSHGVRLVPSQDWAGSNHSFDILFCTWNRDLMWWNRNHTHVATDILNIEFWHSTCKDKIESFIKPVRIIFNITVTSSFQLIKTKDSMIVPKGFPTVNSEMRNKTIKVRRFVISPGTVLRIMFHDLSEPLRYVVLHDEFPVYENFSNASIVTPEQAIIHLSNNNSYAHCFHLGLFPLANASKPLVIYEISSVIYFCIKWNITTNIWQPTCEASINNTLPDTITCDCKNFSVIAGYLQNTESQGLEIMKLDIELELQSNYVIFITVAITFGVYCFLLILASPIPKLNVYFLGDNEKHELYAYLLVISTANVRNAGTTSNVMIRIHGKTGSSHAHVINYPDPKVRLLQRASENWFVLTTEQFLGEITRIELWYDCTGYSPSWYCKQITIYDMQTENSVTFNVSEKFSLVHDLFYVEVELHREKKDRFASKIFNDYHTWICGSNNYNFTCIKRIHVILAMILLTFVFNLILLGVPALELNDSLETLNLSNVDWVLAGFAFLTGSAAFFIVLPIAWMFRWSTVKYHTVLSTLAWILIIFIITVCSTLLLVFGFWVPHTVSLVWLMISIVGILFVVMVLENIVVLIVTPCVKERPYDEVSDKLAVIFEEVEKQRPILYKRFGGSFLRPYFQHLYTPMDKKKIHAKKGLDKSRFTVVGELEDLLMFTIYIIMLYLVILSGKDRKLAFSNTHFVEMAMGMHTRTLDFTNIKHGLQVYEYINVTLINTMQGSEWYPNFVINDPGMMIDYNNKFLGVARVRQHRMERNLCKPPILMKFLNMTCWPEFSIFNADKKGIHGGSWRNRTFNKEKDRLQNIWFYSEQKDTGTLPSYGDFALYSGGGYVAFLGRTLRNSFANFRIIAQKIWIDVVTRSVFIEFLAYNANDNIFNSVTLIFEQSASGFTHSIIKVNSIRLIFVENDEVERLTLIVFALFAFWVVILFVKYSVEIVKKFLTFYKDVWFLIDIFIICMSFVCMAMTLMRIAFVKEYLEGLEKRKHNEFVPYGKLFYHEYIFTIFAAILVSVSTIRLWKFLRFGFLFRVFERTVQLFFWELTTAFFCWLCLCLGFALTAVLLFGNDFTQFSTIYSAIRVLFQWSLKTAIKLKMYTVEDMFFPFFACYVFCVYFMLFLYVAIIVHGYKKAKLEFSEKPDVYNIKHYVIEQMHFWPTLCSSHWARFRGGAQRKTRRLIVPKGNAFRFANCLSAPARRMKSMIVISKCIVKNMTECAKDKRILSEMEVDLMKQACREVLFQDRGPKEMMLFYKGLYHGKRQIVDEERIALMGRIAEALLEKPPNKPRWWMTTSVLSQCCRYIKQNLNTMRRCCLRLEVMWRQVEEMPSVL